MRRRARLSKAAEKRRQNVNDFVLSTNVLNSPGVVAVDRGTSFSIRGRWRQANTRCADSNSASYLMMSVRQVSGNYNVHCILPFMENSVMWDFLEKFTVILGIGTFILSAYNALQFKMLYPGWRVVVLKEGRTLIDRQISAKKAKQISEDPADLITFLKGTVSPYAYLNQELYYEGQRTGLLTIDRKSRQYIIDLDKNPPSHP